MKSFGFAVSRSTFSRYIYMTNLNFRSSIKTQSFLAFRVADEHGERLLERGLEMRVSQCSLSKLERERGDRIAGVAFHVSSSASPIRVLETAITPLQLRRNAIVLTTISPEAIAFSSAKYGSRFRITIYSSVVAFFSFAFAFEIRDFFSFLEISWWFLFELVFRFYGIIMIERWNFTILEIFTTIIPIFIFLFF